MTVIVGLVSEGVVWMGGDARATYEKGTACISLRTPKVHKLGPYLIGQCGIPLLTDIVAYHLKLPPPPPRGLMRFISRKLLPVLKEAIKERGGFMGGLPEGSQMMLGFRGQLFTIDQNTQHYQVRETFHAIGDGAMPARATLYGLRASGFRGLPKDHIRIALEASESVVTTVARPWTILHGGKK